MVAWILKPRPIVKQSPGWRIGARTEGGSVFFRSSRTSGCWVFGELRAVGNLRASADVLSATTPMRALEQLPTLEEKKEVFMFGEWTTEFVAGLLLVAGMITALITAVVLVDWIEQRTHRH